MGTERPMNGRLQAMGELKVLRRRSLIAACLCVAPMAFGQVLSSPMGSAPAAAGQGPGYHSPQSAFPPLVPRADVVPWALLAKVSVKFQKPRITITYSPEVQKFNGTRVKLEGYMTPLEAGTEHRHFLLLSVPPTCPFCVPGGAESMVEVRTLKPVKYTQRAIVVQGQFEVLERDPQGLYYRMGRAKVVR
jgi:uncharacterized protein